MSAIRVGHSQVTQDYIQNLILQRETILQRLRGRPSLLAYNHVVFGIVLDTCGACTRTDTRWQRSNRREIVKFDNRILKLSAQIKDTLCQRALGHPVHHDILNYNAVV